MAVQKKRRRKKSGKYTPLVWLFTGALIAFFISFSNSSGVKDFLTEKYSFKHSKGNGSSSSSDHVVSLSDLKSNLMRSKGSSSSFEAQKRTMFVFLARKTGDSLRIVRKPVFVRPDQTPLKDALSALLRAAPEEGEYNLIPYQTEIRKIWIRDGVAYIDFNDAFNYNSYGYIGYQIQLYQVVYTATQFPSVKAVYFYMNGKPLDVLGGEGYLVNNPVYPYSSLPSFSTE